MAQPQWIRENSVYELELMSEEDIKKNCKNL